MAIRRLSPRFRVNANFRLFAKDGGVGGTTETEEEEAAAVGGRVELLDVSAVDEAADAARADMGVARVAAEVAVTVFLTVAAEIITFALPGLESRGRLRDGRLVGFFL